MKRLLDWVVVATLGLLVVTTACKRDGNVGQTEPTPSPTPTSAVEKTPTPKPTLPPQETPVPTTATAKTLHPAQRGKVRIAWTMESTEETYGFYVYRGAKPSGPWTRVNTTPVLAVNPTSNIPQDYEIMDTHEDLRVGEQYWYWLEVVATSGQRRRGWWPPKAVLVKVQYDQEHPPKPKE